MGEQFRPRIDQREKHEIVESAERKAKQILEKDAIREENFVDLYGEANVKKDTDLVNTLEQKFAESDRREDVSGRKFGKVLEAIVHQHGEQSNWFGPDAVTIRTSRFDDVTNGTDEIVEYNREEGVSFLALAIDATSNQLLSRKIDRIKKEIESGGLAKIKYFEADGVDIRGELSGIPHVVIGADADTIAELALLWLDGKNSDLAVHPIQFQILELIEMQCETYSVYAEKIGKTEVAKKYRNALQIIKEVVSQKRENITDTGARDSLHRSLKLELRDQFSAK